MANEKILIIDDELAIRMALSTAFQREGMQVWEASGGRQALQLLEYHDFDLIVLDVMMQDMDGYSFLQRIRSNSVFTPVLMVSGRTEETAQVLGLGLGADDYITKPFQLSVLIQKVKALIRRRSIYDQSYHDVITVGRFSFDSVKLECYKDNRLLQFSSRELALFRFLMENPNQVFSREQLYRNVWGNSVVDDNTIMVYIRRVREKIEDDIKNPTFIQTVRGFGYKFNG